MSLYSGYLLCLEHCTRRLQASLICATGLAGRDQPCVLYAVCLCAHSLDLGCHYPSDLLARSAPRQRRTERHVGLLVRSYVGWSTKPVPVVWTPDLMEGRQSDTHGLPVFRPISHLLFRIVCFVEHYPSSRMSSVGEKTLISA